MIFPLHRNTGFSWFLDNALLRTKRIYHLVIWNKIYSLQIYVQVNREWEWLTQNRDLLVTFDPYMIIVVFCPVSGSQSPVDFEIETLITDSLGMSWMVKCGHTTSLQENSTLEHLLWRMWILKVGLSLTMVYSRVPARALIHALSTFINTQLCLIMTLDVNFQMDPFTDDDDSGSVE